MTTMDYKLDGHKWDGNNCTHMDKLDERKVDDLELDDNNGTCWMNNVDMFNSGIIF